MKRRIFSLNFAGGTVKDRCLENLFKQQCAHFVDGSGHEDKSEALMKNYKSVMRKVPQPVVVVTTAEYDKEKNIWLKRGVTCSSFTSVSFKPPIVSVAISKPSRMHDLLLRTKLFAVNVLANNQVAYGVHFSKRAQDDADQLKDIAHEQDKNGIPIIEGTSAVLHCKHHQLSCIGDHHVWYGEVLEASSNSLAGDPLLYYLRTFRSIGDETFIQAFENRTLPFEDWTHEAHLRMAWNYIKEYGKEGAVPYIINGIKSFNEQNKDKIGRGYHDTVTRFYIHMVADAIQKSKNPDFTFEEFIQEKKYLTEGDLLFRYYSKDRISTKKAESELVLPDIQSLP